MDDVDEDCTDKIPDDVDDVVGIVCLAVDDKGIDEDGDVEDSDESSSASEDFDPFILDEVDPCFCAEMIKPQNKLSNFKINIEVLPISIGYCTQGKE